MTHKACGQFQPVFSRRDLLRHSGAGFGLLALRGLLGNQASLARAGGRSSSANPLAVRAPHFAPRAKRVIFLFMHGGPSQVDTFDYKPLLARDHGKPLPFDPEAPPVDPLPFLLHNGDVLRRPSGDDG